MQPHRNRATRSTPLIILNSSPARWRRPPLPFDAMLTLRGIGFGVSNELGNCLRWNRWIDHHEKRDANNASNWRDVAEKKETKVVVKRRVDRRRSVNHEERV